VVVAGQPFEQTQQTVADAAGAGTVAFYPPGMDWVVQLTSVSASSNVSEPTTRAYRNGIFKEGSYSGSNDSSDTRVLLRAGDRYEITWAAADVGATLKATLTGIQYQPYQAPAE
jgi:hypothetical protein